ncbi:BRO-N domain-containing protein [Pseudooceanicola sp. 502str34]
MIDDSPWFSAADARTALGISKQARRHATKAHPEKERTMYQIQSGVRSQVLVSDSGLYKLITLSDEPEAKAFQNWVFGTVLLTIRKDGGYIQNEGQFSLPPRHTQRGKHGTHSTSLENRKPAQPPDIYTFKSPSLTTSSYRRSHKKPPSLTAWWLFCFLSPAGPASPGAPERQPQERPHSRLS